MIRRIWSLALLFSAGFAFVLLAREQPVTWGDQVWQLKIDPSSGALVHIENKDDPLHMNWLRDAGRWNRRRWTQPQSSEAVTLDGQWGLVETSATGLLHVGLVRRLSEKAWEIDYTSAVLSVTVRREIDGNGDLVESYTFMNTGNVDLNLPLGSVSITAPLFDQYPDARSSLTSRCTVHVWAGGTSSWINALRMGAQPPHLGLVLTQGSLAAYSQRGGTFSDRGVILLHPPAMKIKCGKSETLAWKLFWHKGWEDFFAKLGATEGFIRVEARRYTVTAGESLEITAESAQSLDGAMVLANGRRMKFRISGGRLFATIPTSQPGEVLVEIVNGGKRAILRANVTPSVDELLAARLKFIVEHQQRNAPGDPLDGAYLAYDNDTDSQIYDAKDADHNAGRERMAMGVLAALYLPICEDPAFKPKLEASVERYKSFVQRELEDDSGVVYGSVGRRDFGRLYNYPWAAHFHLALYQATGDREQLDRYVRVLRSYFARGGARFYAIGMPISEGLKALEKVGRIQEREELLADFRSQADYFLAVGTNYPMSEVNYEQAIVGSGVQLLAEMYVVTGDRRYLDGVKRQMPLLEAFCGRQPDFRLNEISVRHWDDYWFGKLKCFGDTLPHYWSTINALAYAWFGLGTQDRTWTARANTILSANLSLFDVNGRASCAHLYPLAIDSQSSARNDPWANDQDWALVNLLTVRKME